MSIAVIILEVLLACVVLFFLVSWSWQSFQVGMLRKYLNRWFWKKITQKDYKSLCDFLGLDQENLMSVSTAGKRMVEWEWDCGVSVRDTFSRQNGDDIDFWQTPCPETTRCFCRITSCKDGLRVQISKEGQTEATGGQEVYSLITDSRFKLTGPGSKVRFLHSGIVKELPAVQQEEATAVAKISHG
mgnify:CR=1 FL=1